MEHYGVAPANSTKVIMVSALSDRADVEEAFGEAADGYLTKPLEREALLVHFDLMGVLR